MRILAKYMRLPECVKKLGQGSFAESYLTHDDHVVVLSSSKDVDNNVLESFFRAIPTFPEYVRQHLIELLDKRRVKDYESYDIVCSDTRKSPWTRSIDPSFRVETFTFGGNRFEIDSMNIDEYRNLVEQIIPTLAFIQDNGFYHNDINTHGNILVKNVKGKNVYVIIDYDSMSRERSPYAMLNLIISAARGVIQWQHRVWNSNQRKLLEGRHCQFRPDSINENILSFANQNGYRGRSREAGFLFVARYFPFMVPVLTQTMDVEPPEHDWLIDCDRLIRSMEIIEETAKNKRIQWRDIVSIVIRTLFD